MHDLVRLYAMEVAGRDVPADAREAALRRLVGFYLRGAYAAGRLLYPHRVDIEPAACGDGVVPPPMGTAGQALAWCDTEYVGVLAAFRLAAAHTWDDAAWRLAWALDAYCLRRAHLADLVEIWTVATRAVDRLGEPLPRAAARWRLGLSRAIFGERDGVLGLLRTAVALFARAGAAGCQAQVHQSIGLVMSRWKEHEPALHHARRALAMSRTLGNVNGEANALNSMAWCLSQLRRYDLALPHAERALWLFRGGDDPDGEAAALDSMGYIVHQMGRYREAIGYYTSAIRKRRMIGNVGQEPDSLVRIGDSYAALGESCHARAAWRRALALYRRQHRVSEAEQVQARFDGARPPWRPPRPSARHGPSRAAPPQHPVDRPDRAAGAHARARRHPRRVQGSEPYGVVRAGRPRVRARPPQPLPVAVRDHQIRLEAHGRAPGGQRLGETVVAAGREPGEPVHLAEHLGQHRAVASGEEADGRPRFEPGVPGVVAGLPGP
ncbi:hypothetical protein GCM10020001_117610 [Nonomuraea salmonea]